MAVKVPTADGGYIKYKTNDGGFEAVSPIIQEQFQSVLVAQCHQETFFEDVGHLADGPVAQQILDGTYKYPQTLIKQPGCCSRKQQPPMLLSCPARLPHTSLQRFSRTSGKRHGSILDHPIGLHFGCYISASYCPDLSLLHLAKLSICTMNRVPLA